MRLVISLCHPAVAIAERVNLDEFEVRDSGKLKRV